MRPARVSLLVMFASLRSEGYQHLRIATSNCYGTERVPRMLRSIGFPDTRTVRAYQKSVSGVSGSLTGAGADSRHTQYKRILQKEGKREGSRQ
jgi:hypothetical protein